MVRVCLAQPSWSVRGPPTFDRSAWVVLSEGSDMLAAVKCLRDIRIPIPGPVDPNTGNSMGGIEFKMQANIHTQKDLNPLPTFFNRPDRIHFDAARVAELGYLMDKDRGVPEECNLLSVLQAAAAASAESTLSESDRLDISIAYLRRVHFFVYYSGKRFRDEAHLLTVTPNVILRGTGRASAGPPAGGEGEEESSGSGMNRRGSEAEEEGGEDEKEIEHERQQDDEEGRAEDPVASLKDEGTEGNGGEPTLTDDAVVAESRTTEDIERVDLSKPFRGSANPHTQKLDRLV